MAYSLQTELHKLLPQKFQNFQYLLDYLDSSGKIFDELKTLIENLKSLTNVDTVSSLYIDHLAELIDFKVFSNIPVTITDKRKQVKEVVNWYQMKGTSKSFTIMLYALGLTGNVYPLFSDNYINFYRENEFSQTSSIELYLNNSHTLNMGMILSFLYSTPHFELAIDLVSSLNGYLISSLENTLIRDRMELLRPVHTVPRYSYNLVSRTNLTGIAVTQPGNISTVVTDTFVTDNKFLNTGLILNNSEILGIFDEAYYNRIDTFVVGKGSKLKNSFFELFNAGDFTVPDNWVIVGSGLSAAKEYFEKQNGQYSVKLTADSTLISAKLTNNTYTKYTNLLNKVVVITANIKTSIANQITIYIDDGVSTSESLFHTGSNSFEVLSVNHTINSGATKLDISIFVKQPGILYIDYCRLSYNSIFPPIPFSIETTGLEEQIYEGNILAKRSYTDRFEFDFVLPTGILYEDISELGLKSTTAEFLVKINMPDIYRPIDSRLLGMIIVDR